SITSTSGRKNRVGSQSAAGSAGGSGPFLWFVDCGTEGRMDGRTDLLGGRLGGLGDIRVVEVDVAGRPARAGGRLLPAEDGADDVGGGDRGAAGVADGAESVGERAGERGAEDRGKLAVAVLLEDIDSLVPLDEAGHVVRGRQRADAAILGGDPL